jgi:hypothetical protein
MSETKILTAVNILKGDVFKNYQHFTVIATDEDGNTYFTTFACYTNYTHNIEKAFQRLIPVPVKRQEEIHEDSAEELVKVSAEERTSLASTMKALMEEK